MIPRSMVTGKLESAWRVVARSLTRDICLAPDGFSRASGRNASCNLALKLCSAQELNDKKLIGYKACKKNVRCYCAELILWLSQTGD